MEMARYSEKFKARAVARLLPPESAAVDVVAREVGIGSGTLERWRDDVDLSAAASHQRFATPLATMVHMVGAATAAWKRRFWFPTPTSGSDYTPRQVASLLTGGWLLIANVPASAQFWHPG